MSSMTLTLAHITLRSGWRPRPSGPQTRDRSFAAATIFPSSTVSVDCRSLLQRSSSERGETSSDNELLSNARVCYAQPMHRYGQYCPVARAAEILADRWTALIVRELLADINHFNELERGLPHMSRGLLAERLRRLERTGVLERRAASRGKRTEYRLTLAGR